MINRGLAIFLSACIILLSHRVAALSGHEELDRRLLRKLQYHPKFDGISSALKLEQERTLDVDMAKFLHTAALETADTIKRTHGHGHMDHQTVACPCPSQRRDRHPARRQTTGRFHPTKYGADPTGSNDSTAAFEHLVQDLLNVTTTQKMAAGIIDLGGATIDLEGGQYLLSNPLVIPPMYGNAHIVDGTLRASSSFPPGRWLLEIGNANTCDPKLPDGKFDIQYSCNEFIDASSVLLDANFVAAGGIKVERVMGTTLTNVFVTGFTTVGIQVTHGHEVMISDAWLAECYWSNKTNCQNNPQSIGIRIEGTDHYVRDTIIFDFAKVGVEILGAANILQGVHTWNGGGVGISLGNATQRAGANRVIGCYLDYATLDLYDPSDVLVESTFFYYAHAVLRASKSSSEEGGRIDGLTMRFNHYNTNQSVVLDGTFDHVSGVSIVEEINAAKTTRATKMLFQKNATEWVFEFASELLFPTIDRVSFSLTSSHPSFFSHMARPPQGTTVTVHTSEAVDATVYISVEQGL
jgi:hypothetical protein